MCLAALSLAYLVKQLAMLANIKGELTLSARIIVKAQILISLFTIGRIIGNVKNREPFGLLSRLSGNLFHQSTDFEAYDALTLSKLYRLLSRLEVA